MTDTEKTINAGVFKLSKDSKYLDARARIKRRRAELEKLHKQEYGL